MRILHQYVHIHGSAGALNPFQGEHRDGVSRAESHEEWRIIIVYTNIILLSSKSALLGTASMECGYSRGGGETAPVQNDEYGGEKLISIGSIAHSNHLP